MTTFYAQPYDISATGFYFETKEEYDEKVKTLINDYGDPVEEFEIQFIDGNSIDADLCEALDLSQANFGKIIEAIDNWDEWQKFKVIIAVGECGVDFDLEDDPDNLDVEIYEVDSLKELAEQFVDEGLFGEIPENIEHYIDYDAIARDLEVDYTEIKIDGRRMVYRCD